METSFSIYLIIQSVLGRDKENKVCKASFQTLSYNNL